VFGSVVAGAFQIAFRAEMHANDFFYFLKIIFDISTSKRFKKYKLHSILAKKKKVKFGRNAGTNAIPNAPLVTAIPNTLCVWYCGSCYGCGLKKIVL